MSSASPRVSIILFAHAPYARFLAESLGSIVAQSYSSLEVIVLSDGSEAVAKAAAAFAPDGRVTIAPQGHLPFLLATNEIMKRAQGEYLGTWNSDDIYNKDHVKVLVEALESDPEAGAAFDNVEYFADDAANDAEPQLIVPAAQAKKLALARLSVQQIFEENLMAGPAALVTRSAFDRVGGYDGDIFLNCDLHWFYRIGAYFPIRFANYVGVRKRVHPLNNTAANPHYEYGARELENIRDKYQDVYARIGAKVFEKKLGRKYFRLARYYERLGEPEKARGMYKKAMALRKFSFRYRWEYLRTRLFPGAN